MFSKMEILERLSAAGIVPVVVLNDAADAVPTARALLDGGIDVMEITFRTAAAGDAVTAVARDCPDMLVGAGTVITLEQCQRAVEQGAKFIVSPGFDEEVVHWCVDKGITVVPGCATPTEITAALKCGLQVVKFFPANIYGGLSAIKALAAPFGMVKFIPTGGINIQNLAEYIASPFVHAVGGSWVCSKKDIAEGNFETITALCQKARQTALGFSFGHVGINCNNEKVSADVCGELERAFGFSVRAGSGSNFSTSAIEVMKSNYPGACGHLAIGTNSIEMAVAELTQKGM